MDDRQRLLHREIAPIEPLLVDPAVTNIHVNTDGSVFARRGSKDERTPVELSPEQRLALLRTIAALNGLAITRERPTLECRLPTFGVRLAGTIPPVTTAPAMVLRRAWPSRLHLDDYVRQEALRSGEARYIQEAMRRKRTIVVAGATDSGKTTLVNALLAEIEAVDPQARLVILEEDVRELVTESSNAIHLLAGHVRSAQQLLRLALRMNPDRIIVGEARGPECYQWLRAANTGHPGGLLTLHANSAEAVIERIADLIAEAGVTPSPRRIARTIDLVLYMRRDPETGARTVSAIREVACGTTIRFVTPDCARPHTEEVST